MANNITQGRPSTYQILVYIAYAFYILLGLSWLLMSYFGPNGYFNANALVITGIFCAQAYFRHRLTNLILGIVAMFFSIFMLLQVLNMILPATHKGHVIDWFDRFLITLPIISLLMSGILIFSILKLNVKD